MSLCISSFLPNGNYLVAADTRISDRDESGAPVIIPGKAHKLTLLSKHTAMFMSGCYAPVACVAREYKLNFREDAAKSALTQCARKWLRRISSDDLERAYRQMGEAMAFFLFRFGGGAIETGIYLSTRNFVPLECPTSPGGVIVLGPTKPGTTEKIRASVNDAKTHESTIKTYRNIYNDQCSAMVGGDLELYEFSLVHGIRKRTAYQIIGKES